MKIVNGVIVSWGFDVEKARVDLIQKPEKVNIIYYDYDGNQIPPPPIKQLKIVI